jgi:hypothetical protein
MAAMLRLLQDLAVDPDYRVDADNPLRQVIVNTHSPVVAGQVPEDALLLVTPRTIRRAGQPWTVPVFRWLTDTWRAKAHPEIPTVALGEIISYLSPIDPTPALDLLSASIRGQEKRRPVKRIIDRDDVQAWLPFLQPQESELPDVHPAVRRLLKSRARAALPPVPRSPG